jgi:hypothetical protein
MPHMSFDTLIFVWICLVYSYGPIWATFAHGPGPTGGQAERAGRVPRQGETGEAGEVGEVGEVGGVGRRRGQGTGSYMPTALLSRTSRRDSS